MTRRARFAVAFMVGLIAWGIADLSARVSALESLSHPLIENAHRDIEHRLGEDAAH